MFSHSNIMCSDNDQAVSFFIQFFYIA